MFKKIMILAFVFFCFPFLVNAEEKNVRLYLFHGDGCPHCAEEISFLNSIENKYESLEIVKYEVWYSSENDELMRKVKEAFDVNSTGVPTTVIGDTIIVGYGGSASASKLERAIQFYLESEEYEDIVSQIKDGTYEKKQDEEKQESDFDKKEQESDEEVTIDVPLIGKLNLKKVSLTTAAVLIGFIDGFNPCAMWVLLFLISVLIGMKDRRRMWILGLAFLLTSAFIYMLIMLSWISIVIKVTMIVWIRRVIAAIAVAGGLWNLRGYLKSKESGCEVVDDKKRKSIFKKIRRFTSEKSFILALLGVVGLAISVNLIELACSAGLPLIFTEVLALNNVDMSMRFVYTLLYIVFFLIDDFIIFFIAMFTMKITGISTKYNKYSHLIGGIIMLLVGILLIFKPEWLMFQFK